MAGAAPGGGKATASGGAGVGPSRRTWDVEEYTSKARERDREDKERAVENEERLRKGERYACGRHRCRVYPSKPLRTRRSRPPFLPASAADQGLKPATKRKEELPKATMDLQARVDPLELDKNQGKTMMVEGKQGPGFYCQLCNRTCKDSARYLDHINGRLREYALSRILAAHMLGCIGSWHKRAHARPTALATSRSEKARPDDARGASVRRVGARQAAGDAGAAARRRRGADVRL